MELTKTRLIDGIWEGLLTGAAPGAAPALAVTHLGQAVPGVTVTPMAEGGGWLVRVPLPAAAIADGVQTILIAEAATEVVLERVTVIAGDPLDEDIRAEMDLLRAELDMLKRAFRRHCVETA
jgi:hypothetical protein